MSTLGPLHLGFGQRYLSRLFDSHRFFCRNSGRSSSYASRKKTTSIFEHSLRISSPNSCTWSTDSAPSKASFIPSSNTPLNGSLKVGKDTGKNKTVTSSFSLLLALYSSRTYFFIFSTAVLFPEPARPLRSSRSFFSSSLSFSINSLKATLTSNDLLNSASFLKSPFGPALHTSASTYTSLCSSPEISDRYFLRQSLITSSGGRPTRRLRSLRMDAMSCCIMSSFLSISLSCPLMLDKKLTTMSSFLLTSFTFTAACCRALSSSRHRTTISCFLMGSSVTASASCRSASVAWMRVRMSS